MLIIFFIKNCTNCKMMKDICGNTEHSASSKMYCTWMFSNKVNGI